VAAFAAFINGRWAMGKNGLSCGGVLNIGFGGGKLATSLKASCETDEAKASLGVVCKDGVKDCTLSGEIKYKFDKNTSGTASVELKPGTNTVNAKAAIQRTFGEDVFSAELGSSNNGLLVGIGYRNPSGSIQASVEGLGKGPTQVKVGGALQGHDSYSLQGGVMLGAQNGASLAYNGEQNSLGASFNSKQGIGMTAEHINGNGSSINGKVTWRLTDDKLNAEIASKEKEGK
jgi:hypothetical protein